MAANKTVSSGPPTDEPGPAKVATDAAHALFMESTTILWIAYRHTLSRPARLVVPEHTRDAFFQAFCDLRTNSPKDRKWLKRHLTALKPRTANGWLALSAALLLGISGLTGLLGITAAALTVLIYSTLFVSFLAGVASGALLTAVSVAMLIAAGVAAASSAFVAWGYAVIEAGSRVAAWARGHPAGPGAKWPAPSLHERLLPAAPEPSKLQGSSSEQSSAVTNASAPASTPAESEILHGGPDLQAVPSLQSEHSISQNGYLTR